MHSSLVITPEGLPLGLAAVKFWSRKKFKGCSARKREINPIRVPKVIWGAWPNSMTFNWD